jgi:hypothetical protein
MRRNYLTAKRHSRESGNPRHFGGIPRQARNDVATRFQQLIGVILIGLRYIIATQERMLFRQKGR